MAVTKPCLNEPSFSIPWSIATICIHIFFDRSLFFGGEGVPPHQRHHQIPSNAQTGTMTFFPPLLSIATFSCEKSLIRHHFVLSYLFFYRPAKETTCPIGFLGQFYIRKVMCPQSADGVLIMKNAFIDHTQIVKIKIHNYVPNKSCISESIRCIA